MHHFGHADGGGARESSLGKAHCFEVYAIGLVLCPLAFALQILDHAIAVQSELGVLVKEFCCQISPM